MTALKKHHVLAFLFIVIDATFALILWELYTNTHSLNSLGFYSLLVGGLLISVLIFRWAAHHLDDYARYKNLPPISSAKKEFYIQQGLSRAEIKFFRSTMQEALQWIQKTEQQLTQSSRLQMIDHRYQTVATLKNFFQEIVAHPLKLARVNHFLYEDLPSLATLTEKFLTLEKHPNKNKPTLQILDKIIVEIEKTCAAIEAHYLEFETVILDEVHVKTSENSAEATLRKEDEHE